MEAALASHFSADKLGAKNKKKKTDIKAAFLLKFSADLKKNLRATKQRLQQERDQVVGIAEDMGIDLLSGTVMRQPILVNMTHREARHMFRLHSLDKRLKDD